MFPIRMQKRACTDTDKIESFLQSAKTGFLGLSAGNQPYVVPLNYVWHRGAVYFHGAAEGRKITYMQQNAEACFTVCEQYGTTTSPVPALTDTAFMSVMVFGHVHPVTDLDEATEAMQAMLDKYVPGYYKEALSKTHVDKYRSSLGSRTAVFRLTASSVTSKESVSEGGSLFYPGKTVRDDQ